MGYKKVIIYKLIVFAVVTPFIYACANFAIKLSGTGFLTKKTLKNTYFLIGIF